MSIVTDFQGNGIFCIFVTIIAKIITMKAFIPVSLIEDLHRKLILVIVSFSIQYFKSYEIVSKKLFFISTVPGLLNNKLYLFYLFKIVHKFDIPEVIQNL